MLIFLCFPVFLFGKLYHILTASLNVPLPGISSKSGRKGVSFGFYSCRSFALRLPLSQVQPPSAAVCWHPSFSFAHPTHTTLKAPRHTQQLTQWNSNLETECQCYERTFQTSWYSCLSFISLLNTRQCNVKLFELPCCWKGLYIKKLASLNLPGFVNHLRNNSLCNSACLWCVFVCRL